MKHWYRLTPLLLAVVALLFATPALRSQAAKPDMKEPARARIAIYRVATGKHLEFLKWLADTDVIEKEAGVPVSQLYAHTDGDSWDYIQISADLTKEQSAKVDEVTKKHGRKTGFASSLEFRTFIASHTDTFAIGPVTAADLVAMANK